MGGGGNCLPLSSRLRAAKRQEPRVFRSPPYSQSGHRAWHTARPQKIVCRTDGQVNGRTGVPRARSFSCSEPGSTVQFVSWGLIQCQGPRLALPCPELRRPHLLGWRMDGHFSRRTAELSRGPGHGRTGAERPWACSRGAGAREPDSYSFSHPHWPRHLKKSCRLSLDL